MNPYDKSARVRGAMTFRCYPGTAAPFACSLSPDLVEASPLVAADVLRDWITRRCPDIDLPYASMERVVELATESNRVEQDTKELEEDGNEKKEKRKKKSEGGGGARKDGRSRAVTISKDWDILRLGGELRLVRRSEEARSEQEERSYLSLASPDGAVEVAVCHPRGTLLHLVTDSRKGDQEMREGKEQRFHVQLQNLPVEVINPSQRRISLRLRFVHLPTDTVYLANGGKGDKEMEEPSGEKRVPKRYKVKDLLVDKKVPWEERDRVLTLLLGGEGEEEGEVVALLLPSGRVIIANHFIIDGKVHQTNSMLSHGAAVTLEILHKRIDLT